MNAVTKTPAVKPVFAAVLMLSDAIRAEAGVGEAVFESRLSALYSAYYHVLKSNNKTQFNLVADACKRFAAPKECAAELGIKSVAAAAVKRMNAVYLAYGSALAAVTLPVYSKGRTAAELDALASDCALQVATIVTGALVPAAAPTVEEAEAKKAKAAAAKAEKEAKAKAEQQAAVDAKVADIAAASALTMADMVQAVANAVRMGLASVEQLETLNDALDAVAANVALVPVGAQADAPVAHA